jgi:3',5'-cyclic AMP phosphodiesterase CpdA
MSESLLPFRLLASLLAAAAISLSVTASAAPVVAYAAGDIGVCGTNGAATTAALIGADAQVVFAVGDLAYPSGTREEFRDCYEPAWGKFRDRLLPVPGNHEYRTAGAAGYFGWFGEAIAGTAAKSYYRRDLPGWRVLALDSNLRDDAAAAQQAWLVAELARPGPACTLALMHHPRFSSGKHGDSAHVDGLWRALAAQRTAILLTGHDHHYERFAPLDADGARRADGTRSFLVGTGGAHLYPLASVRQGSEFRDQRRWGMLRLELGDGRYRWQYRVAGGTVIDEGGGECPAR